MFSKLFKSCHRNSTRSRRIFLVKCRDKATSTHRCWRPNNVASMSNKTTSCAYWESNKFDDKSKIKTKSSLRSLIPWNKNWIPFLLCFVIKHNPVQVYWNLTFLLPPKEIPRSNLTCVVLLKLINPFTPLYFLKNWKNVNKLYNFILSLS